MNLINRIAKFSRDYSFGSGIIEFGIIAIIFGIIAFKWNNARLDYPMIEAEVTGVALEQEAYDDGNTHYDATYTVDIKYSVDGREYGAKLNDQPETKVGKIIRIDYNPSDPTDIGHHEAAWFPAIIIAVGVLGIVIGIVSIVKNRNKNVKLRKQEEEWSNGKNL
ncbi:MAG: DUF3592 domain-containing protein [Lachnospiraceae bacterium]|nr:DUF3592 domain-containing protein [Lachnospiraceae bacterium]